MDTANGDGGGWPAGSATGFFSMERINPLAEDTDSNWVANNGTTRNGTDSVAIQSTAPRGLPTRVCSCPPARHGYKYRHANANTFGY
ncbi:hypothetical protein EMGBS3_11310, partial [Anaerolineaceae bacterium]